ncbi:MAG: hypothetical protein JSV49_08455 [Thermoplasmata archaeon]|nr:MAG: hypothetical protein JSV49_08455 [Thermoplasmata archaeon]
MGLPVFGIYNEENVIVDNTLSLEKSRGRSISSSTFIATNIWNQPGGSLAGGIVLGDPDNDNSKEVVVVGGGGNDGHLTVIKYNGTKEPPWEKPTIWKDKDALVDVVVADIDPHEEGNEIVAGGYAKNITVLYWPGGDNSPRTHIIDALPNQIFGMAAGELNLSHEGVELAVVDGITNNLYIYQSTNTPDSWDKIIVTFEEPLRNVYVGEYDSKHQGAEIIALSLNNTVYSAMLSTDNKWQVESLYKDSGQLLDAAIGNADPRYDGNEIIIVGFSQNVTMLRKTESGSWNITTLWTAPGGLEGIDIGDFDPSLADNEIAIGGYSRTVVMLYLDDDRWNAKEIYKDPETSQQELNGVVIGEFNPGHQGNEVMVVGASGVTTMLSYEYPDFTISSASSSKTISAGSDTVFTIVIGTVSSFTGTVTLDVDSDLETELSPSSITAPGTSTLTIHTTTSTEIGTYPVNVSASYDGTTKTLELELIVESSKQPDFKLELSTKSIELERLPADLEQTGDSSDSPYVQSITITIQSINDFNGNVELNVTGLPEYFEVIFSLDKILVGETSQLRIQIVSNPPGNEDSFTFNIKAQSGELQQIEIVDIQLKPSQAGESDEVESESSAWISRIRTIMIVGIIILVIIIIIVINNKYKGKSIPEEKEQIE